MDTPQPAAATDLLSLLPFLEGLAQIHAWVGLSDPNGRAIWSSDKRLPNAVLAGLEAGPPLVTLLPVSETHPDGREIQNQLTRIHQSLLSEIQPDAFSIVFEDTSGTDQRVQLKTFSTRIDSGQCFLISVTDPVSIDVERDQASALKRTNEDLESCLQILSHDLRSPLVSLLGFSRLLRDDYAEIIGDEGRRFINRIEQAAHALNEKLDQTLNFSRISVQQANRKLINPRETLMQIESEIKLQLEQTDTSLVIGQEMPTLFCDPQHLHQVFFRLIENAIQHRGDCENRKIEIEVKELGQSSLIQVRDHGKGIQTQDLKTVFNIFHSGLPPDQKTPQSGMGLAIVRRIASVYGGEAWAESAPGMGAQFYVKLPSE
ncbi:MAG: hypothetical protein CL917_12505 [Deltaproteobacteria bacterium]|nr:hypothetical protein [Deltaproteobacteria bacterium]